LSLSEGLFLPQRGQGLSSALSPAPDRLRLALQYSRLALALSASCSFFLFHDKFASASFSNEIFLLLISGCDLKKSMPPSSVHPGLTSHPATPCKLALVPLKFQDLIFCISEKIQEQVFRKKNQGLPGTTKS
jgi:hypothetical protein